MLPRGKAIVPPLANRISHSSSLPETETACSHKLPAHRTATGEPPLATVRGFHGSAGSCCSSGEGTSDGYGSSDDISHLPKRQQRPEKLLLPLCEQPFIQRWVAVSLRPAIVADARILGVFGRSAGGFEGFDHFA